MLTLVLFQASCFGALLWLVIFHLRRIPFYKLAAKIPQIEGQIPIMGLAYKFIGGVPKDFYKNFKSITKPGPPSPRGFWMGSFFQVVVDDLNQLQDLLASKHCIEKADFYNVLFFEKGLLLSGGNLWRSHRKLIEPAFNATILKSFLPIFNEKSEIFLGQVCKKLGGPEFDISDLTAPLALDNILTTSTGLRKDIQTNKHNEFLEHCMMMMHVGITKLSKFWLHISPLYKCTATYQLEKKHIWGGMCDTAREVIRQKEMKGEPEDNEDSSHTPQIFIDQLFKKRDSFTNEEIMHEINTIIITGFETVSNTMSLFTLLMSFHPKIQEKVFEELQTVFKTAAEHVTEDHLNKLVYLDLVIKEVLRFWSPVPFIARCLTKDVQIGDYVVPRGSNIVVPFLHIHRSKQIWGEDADEFKPERFKEENFSKLHPFAFSPFSRGPRNCIGYKYAMMSMKVVLSHLYRNFRFTTTLKIEDITFEYAIMVRAVQGYMVSIEKREFEKKGADN